MLLKAEGLYVFGPYRLAAHERLLPRDGEAVPLPPRDMSPDGRFLLGEVVPRPSVTRMDLVLNWTATLPRGR